MLIYISSVEKLKTIYYYFFLFSPKQSFNDFYYVAYMNCISIGESS